MHQPALMNSSWCVSVTSFRTCIGGDRGEGERENIIESLMNIIIIILSMHELVEIYYNTIINTETQTVTYDGFGAVVCSLINQSLLIHMTKENKTAYFSRQEYIFLHWCSMLVP